MVVVQRGPMMDDMPNPDTINEARAALALYDEDGSLDNNDLQRVMPLMRWALRVLADTRAVADVATHTNYNTGEPCFCDAPFDYQPGPCVDAEPPTDSTDPANGSG